MIPPNEALALYKAWSRLDKGIQAKLRRADSPDKLLGIPDFYVLASKFGWPEERYALQRMIYCLATGAIKHSDDESLTLGKSLAQSKKISLMRVMQLVRQDYPNDMLQLRRMLIHAEPVLHWPALAAQLQWWGKRERRMLIESFVLSSPKK
ncbi:type I-E CRISPR-associated protein Cse2/CasB [Pantoea sp. GD03673]|uniref:type I-E CRISPR-associated protein Cse2/CasB n=1 Tax=Pantoea sp. GD03673 TaxID=2975364 RepID=UPI00244838A8|nr:type I-E CRISPR-associated protein Cse2/CasB [Pantoea sp. GD03673]MDH2069548.1 type I-E CRISPR-associated protein Cse2/CasB [Pantoea sp. GD03673]